MKIHKSMLYLCGGLIVIASILYVSSKVNGGESMGLFRNDVETVYPFSGFEGQLLYKGKPASKAKITRKYKQMDERTVEETVITDNDGQFSFKSIAIQFRSPKMAVVDYLSHQNILVYYNNEEFHIWEASKMLKDEFSEFGGKSDIKIQCELTDDPVGIDMPIGLFATSCRWD